MAWDELVLEVDEGDFSEARTVVEGDQQFRLVDDGPRASLFLFNHEFLNVVDSQRALSTLIKCVEELS